MRLYAVVYRLPRTGKYTGDIYDDLSKAIVMSDAVREAHGCSAPIVTFNISEDEL